MQEAGAIRQRVPLQAVEQPSLHRRRCAHEIGLVDHPKGGCTWWRRIALPVCLIVIVVLLMSTSYRSSGKVSTGFRETNRYTKPSACLTVILDPAEIPDLRPINSADGANGLVMFANWALIRLFEDVFYAYQR